MAAPEVSSTRLYLGNLPRDGMQKHPPRFHPAIWLPFPKAKDIASRVLLRGIPSRSEYLRTLALWTWSVLGPSHMLHWTLSLDCR